MNQIQTNNKSIFNFQGYKVRTILKDGEPWFVLKDVCDALGLTNSREVSASLPKHTVSSADASHFSGNSWSGNKLNIVNESGLYLVIFKSRKETAVQFQLWITSEVLPSIRKTGSYGKNNLESLMKSPKQLGLAIIEYAEQIEKLEMENSNLSLENKIKQNRLNLLTHSQRTYTATDIAKELGFTSARSFNQVLLDMKIMYRDKKGDLQPTYKYSDKGYFDKKQEILSGGKEVYYTRFTQKGREWILHILDSYV